MQVTSRAGTRTNINCFKGFKGRLGIGVGDYSVAVIYLAINAEDEKGRDSGTLNII